MVLWRIIQNRYQLCEETGKEGGGQAVAFALSAHSADQNEQQQEDDDGSWE